LYGSLRRCWLCYCQRRRACAT
jgi:hypothetical protein